MWWLAACTGDDQRPPAGHTAAPSAVHTGSPRDTGTPYPTEVPLDTGAPGFRLLLTEVHADVAADAGCDGVVDERDGFVELVNVGSLDVPLGDVTLEVAGLVHHTFPPGSTLAAGEAWTVFSGPPGAGGAEAWCGAEGRRSAADRPFELAACGPWSVALVGPIGFVLDTAAVDGGACPGRSVAREPEGQPGAAFVAHPEPWACSPGLRADGSAW